MLYVFVDESGDLGFTGRSTNYYIIAGVETKNLLKLSRIIKKVRKTLGKKKKNIPEFKFTESDEIIRKRLLKRAVEEELLFSAVILQKRMVYDYLRDKKDKLYNYLAGFIAESLSDEYNHGDSQKHPGLQIADFIAGAIFQHYERGKQEFYDIIKPKLRLELRKWF